MANSDELHYVQEIIIEKQEKQHAVRGITLHHITVKHQIQYTEVNRRCKTILPTTAEHSFEGCHIKI